MYCSRCGARIDSDSVYCSKCGFCVSDRVVQNSSSVNLKNNKIPKKNSMKSMILIGLGIGVGLTVLIFTFMYFFGNTGSDYYFSNYGYNDDVENSETKKNKKSGTVIITDNVYNGVSISNVKDANKLISKDSTDQKKNCPKEILAVEDKIIKKYGITAVNLCEMEVGFAEELVNLFDVIYKEYPSARNHLTNLSLNNTSMVSQSGVIAVFMPVFNFATADTSTTYPWVIKTQVLLSSTYFLNKNKLEASVNDGALSGHFPPNATLYSPVAHEMGHYLSFLAMLNNYDMDSVLLINSNNVNKFYKIYDDFAKGDFSLKIIKDAYNNYRNDFSTVLDFDEWRGTISKYSLAKDNNGEYIYDETIAEAFHDVYLNGNSAKDASKYIVAVLKQNLEKR